MNRYSILVALCVLGIGSCFLMAAQERKDVPQVAASSHNQQSTADAIAPGGTPAAAHAPAVRSTSRTIEAAEDIEGEKRFRTNCGRCHQAPHKFPPRTMATVIRHMRVRAMITDEDMRLILHYMTQ
jgi:cytochrome c5